MYSYDLSTDGLRIGNKRPVYMAQDWVPDGLKVAENGFVGEFCFSHGPRGVGRGREMLMKYSCWRGERS